TVLIQMQRQLLRPFHPSCGQDTACLVRLITPLNGVFCRPQAFRRDCSGRGSPTSLRLPSSQPTPFVQTRLAYRFHYPRCTIGPADPVSPRSEVYYSLQPTLYLI